MAEHTKNLVTVPERRDFLPELPWQDVTEPGAYVELGTGDLFRIPKEALLPGASPLIRKESASPSRLIRISRNPYVITFEARMLCAEHNVEPNF